MTMSSILIVGTVSNVATDFSNDYSRLLLAFSSFATIDTFLVESDSTDSTLMLLNSHADHNESFEFKSLGNLKEALPERISRIRECRNVYVKYIRDNYAKYKWDFVVVADLDGVNRKISSQGVASSLKSDIEWDQISSNQTFGYYDLLALRHARWMPNDCLTDLNWARNTFLQDSNGLLKLLRSRLRNDAFRRHYVYDKMYKISQDSAPIEVESAFGGLAIYKTNVFLEFDYEIDADSISSESEHVTLHRKMRAHGYRLYINPRMINSGVNDHNINRVFVVRQMRDLAKRFIFLRQIGRKLLGFFLR